jgi:hypothetical protein
MNMDRELRTWWIQRGSWGHLAGDDRL